jgi:hypothetical protein
LANCTYPTAAVPSVVCNAYNRWYGGITTTTGATSGRRVYDKTFDSSNTTSEGMGYGMLIAVYMGDKPTFDQFWQYANSHFVNGLMSWHISATGGAIDPHSATDADEDMAWSLVMADKQWGGGPSSGGGTYLSLAKSMITAIKSSEMTGNLPTDGDYSAPVSHPDYAAPDYNAEFATLSGDTSWNAVSASEYTAFQAARNSSSGLIPDATTGTGNNLFGFDACRAPWRVGVDYCWHGGGSQAFGPTQFLGPMITTFVALAKPTYPGTLELPLSLAGSPTANTTGTAASLTGAISGPAAVAAMTSPNNQAFIDASWTWLRGYVQNASGPGVYGASGDYFGSTLGLLALLMLDGDFIDYTHPPQ